MPEIIFQLACAIHALLNEELRLARRPGRHIGERLALRIHDILCRAHYRDKLLFRDFGCERGGQWLRPAGVTEGEPEPDSRGSPKGAVYMPAQAYIALVISRRLKLAKKLKGAPTNMHCLLAALVAHGPEAEGWPQVSIARAPECPEDPQQQPEYFRPVARALAHSCKVLGRAYGADSAAARKQLGPYWLCIERAAAEVAEELNLWDCVSAVPVPVERDLDQATLYALADALSSLNRRYALLRACGLDPEDWYDDDSLSIDNLRDLSALRDAAAERRANPDGTAEESVEIAYRKAFEHLKGDQGTYGGFHGFDRVPDPKNPRQRAFAGSPVGEQMMHGGGASLDAAVRKDEDAVALIDLIDPQGQIDTSDLTTEQREQLAVDLPRILAECPGLQRDRVLGYVADQCLLGRRPIHGPEGVLADSRLRELVDRSRTYPATDDEALISAIERGLYEALRYCVKRLLADLE